MFDIGGAEFLMIGLAILLLFGPKKIPEVMRSVGKGIRYFRQAQEDFKTQIRDISTEVDKQTNFSGTISSAQSPDIHIEAHSTEKQTITLKPAEGSIARNESQNITEDSSEIAMNPNPQQSLEQGE